MADDTGRKLSDLDGDSTDDTEFLGARDLTSWPTSWGHGLASSAVAAAAGARRYLDGRSVPYVVLLVTTMIGVVVAGVLTALSAQIYDNVADRDGVAGLDRPVLDQMIRWRSPGLDDVVTVFTDLGSTAVMPWLAAAAAGLLSWWWRRLTPVLLMVIGAGGSLAMTVIGKQVIDRARPARALAVPPYETSPSFPSGHTLNTWVIVMLIGYLVCLRLHGLRGRVAVVGVAVVFGLAMAASRVYLGHHWLTDVLVALTLGSAWLIVVVTGHRLALTVKRRQHEASSSS